MHPSLRIAIPSFLPATAALLMCIFGLSAQQDCLDLRAVEQACGCDVTLDSVRVEGLQSGVDTVLTGADFCIDAQTSVSNPTPRVPAAHGIGNVSRMFDISGRQINPSGSTRHATTGLCLVDNGGTVIPALNLPRSPVTTARAAVSRSTPSPLSKGLSGTAGDYLFTPCAAGFASESVLEASPFDSRTLTFVLSPGCDTPGFWFDWQCRPPSDLPLWGLGSVEQDYVHTDRVMEWYIDQGTTGGSSNCGPSVAAMATNWYTCSLTTTAQYARSQYRPGGDWWYTSDIDNFLDDMQVPHEFYAFTGVGQLQAQVDQGNVVILCLTTAELRRTYEAEHRTDRFYSYADGHFILVKGCRTVDDSVFVESYDPNSWSSTYADGSLRGRNRHYRAKDIETAVSVWWDYIIAVSGPGAVTKSRAESGALDPAEVPVMWGR